MATYKVLQDIEAEDKFLGPLTLKQFIFAAITVLCLYLSFFTLTRGIWFVAVILLPFMLVFGFLAFPWGRDQPTEIWLLAKLRYYFKPRKRIWDQTGMQELVKITAPKKAEEHLTDGLSRTEVKSRLQALADTIDSRGWVIKNVNINMYAQPGYGAAAASDRLVDPSMLPQNGSAVDVTTNDDIFENSLANRLDAQIAQSKKEHQDAAVQHMQSVIKQEEKADTEPQRSNRPAPNLWFMEQSSRDKQPAGYTMFQSREASPTNSSTDALPKEFRKEEPLDEASNALLSRVHANKMRDKEQFRNHRSLEPYDPSKTPSAPVTATPPPDILNAAIDSSRTVESLAREAQKNHPNASAPDDGEVVVTLR